MKFLLKDLNPGVWFDLEEKEEGNNASVCLRVCDSDSLKDIFKKTTKTKVIFKDRQRYEFEEEDANLRSNLIWDYCITDWKNLTDENNNPISCTTEMKLLLMGKSVAFATFISEKISELNNSNKIKEEELEKN